ncbi:two-component sensor histidine kinase [Actinorhabdospora filicis]|uniref:histidine kinase n=1 Tax=Actinorhabdospora filicis TaxID=1785913 RepID=A0A9W6SQD7_9ACTN|nr:sensor histidine kinase [Actinorhabdospora filicis]GLZ80433.1 two-component sensor histidine kinase [Actinorhabdospora filicis]
MVVWKLQGRLADAAIAAGVGLAVLIVALVGLGYDAPEANGWLAWPLIVISAAALYFRRSQPLPVALVTLVCCALYYPLTGPDGMIILTFLVALYTVAADYSLLAASVLAAAPLLAIILVEARSQLRHLDDVAIFMLAGWLVAIIAAGGVVHNRRAYLAEAEQRTLAARRVREEEGRLRASEERLRIARELHDVIGHNISLINVQAAAALHRRESGQALDALAAIKDTSKETLRELRATLGVLRQVDEAAPVAPAPGVGDLRALVERTAATGLHVDLDLPGGPPLPAEVDLAAYRIVQESLTNVTRHSGATRVSVRVTRDEDAVRLEVADDGHGPGEATPGHGLRGMDERARALGGSFSAGAAEDGGFRVSAVLPVRRD